MGVLIDTNAKQWEGYHFIRSNLLPTFCKSQPPKQVSNKLDHWLYIGWRLIALLNYLCCDSHNYTNLQYFINIKHSGTLSRLFGCKCPLFVSLNRFNIWCSYALQEFVAIVWGFAQNPNYSYINRKRSFLEAPSTRNLRMQPCTYWKFTQKLCT